MGRARGAWLPLLLTLAASSAHAQFDRIERGEDLAVAVVVPPTLTGFDPAVLTQLESRLAQFLTGTGFAAVPGGSTLVLYPGLVVLEENVVEGMQRRTVVKLDLSLYLKNAADGVLFASMSQVIAATGPNRNAAVINAVSSLRGSDPAVLDFISSARGRIQGYYARNCERVITEGRTHAGTGDIARAMAVLLSVPRESSSCHEHASRAALELFAETQERDCRSRLQRARAETAVRHYVDAIDALEGIDPASTCARDADRLLAQIAAELERREQRELQRRLQTIRVERDRITQALDAPTKITTRKLTLASDLRVVWLKREPRPAFGPELFR